MEKFPRAKFVQDVESELSRAWWNVLYWGNYKGANDCQKFGWDATGKRQKVTHKNTNFV